MSETEHPMRVLVVDDEESMRFFVRRGLSRLGFDVDVHADGPAALAALGDAPFDALVVDYKMPGMDGLEVLRTARARDGEIAILVMTAHGTIETAVEAMRLGADDFVTKPFEIDELRIAIQRSVERRRGGADPGGELGLIGISPAMRELRAAVERLGGSDVTVLLTGESGTGKEVVARALHAGSARAGGPFVALHCAALPQTLFESELFGHEQGAFTGAEQRRIGKLERADGGVLFLDEITEIDLAAQAKLGRFLQDRSFVPLGGSETRTVDVRIVAASNRDPAELVERGEFRRELYFRLNVVPLRVPPLRERRDDVPVLAQFFAERACRNVGVALGRFSDAALAALSGYDWPGNVRELENVVQRVVVLHAGKEEFGVADLPEEFAATVSDVDGLETRAWQEAVAGFEKQYLEELCRKTHGNVSEAARIAGLSRGHLHRKIKQLGIDPDRYR